MSTYGERDMAAWREWKRNPNDYNLQQLLQQLNPVIQNEVNRWTGTLARPALELEAKRLAVEAFNSYQPSRGAALSTHVTNRLKKLSRLNYTHQNIARIPEYQSLKFRTFENSMNTLTDNLGREPTIAELADDLRWSTPAVKRFQKNIRREFVESGDLPSHFDQGETQDGVLDYVYYDLNPIQQKILEHTTGYGGAKTLSNPQLRRKLKLSQGQLSYQKRLLTNRIERALKENK